jgi:hypothetical protein
MLLSSGTGTQSQMMAGRSLNTSSFLTRSMNGEINFKHVEVLRALNDADHPTTAKGLVGHPAEAFFIGMTAHGGAMQRPEALRASRYPAGV